VSPISVKKYTELSGSTQTEMPKSEEIHLPFYRCCDFNSRNCERQVKDEDRAQGGRHKAEGGGNGLLVYWFIGELVYW